MYGPFNYNGQFTSESNARFDQWLKARDPASGVRDFETVDALAQQQGLSLQQDYPMPANNRILLIRPDLSVIQAAYFTRASWKNFFTRSGDFSNDCMCSVAAAFNLALVRTGTFV